MRHEFTSDELLAEHPYDRPLIVDRVRCHGGFVGERYVSPRTLVRSEAIAAWQSRLPAGELAAVLDPITAAMPPHFPNDEQTRLLVREGVTTPLVRILTLIAAVEGFGGDIIGSLPVPPLRERVVEPIDGTALAHLPGLFAAHARDETGHRQMWELARDIALDRPEIPKDLAGGLPPSSGPRLLPEIPADLEALLLRMTGVLVIEVFAMEAFRWAKAVLGDASLFPRHAEAKALVGYIQEDEAPHVAYLGTALAELRCRTLRGADAQTIPGRGIVDRVRDVIVAFQTGPRHQANVDFRTQVVERYAAEHPRREALLGEFRALA